MYSSDKVVQVGAPDPELKNSPIEQEADEELDYISSKFQVNLFAILIARNTLMEFMFVVAK